MKKITRKMKKLISPIFMISPAVLWLVMFIVIPIGFIFFISFMTKNVYGGYIHKLDLTVYLRFFNNRYLRIFGYSALIALATTIVCLLLGYPFAYIISTSSKRTRNLLVMAIMLPFWINSLIRTSGWITILRLEGVANTILQRLNIIQEPLKMLYTDGAVLFGMVYVLFPFMVLPLYSSLEKLDPALLEASSDLGAKPYRTFLRVVLPQTFPGIFAGSIQVFVPSLGFFYIADIMGGGKTILIGNLIKNQFTIGRDWPFGAALSIILVVLTLILLRLYTKIGSMEDLA